MPGWPWSVLRIAAGVYVGLCVWMLLGQSRYVYFPEKRIRLTPRDAGLAYEDLTLRTSDGVAIAAWYLPSGLPQAPTLLFCHGNAGNMGDRLDSLAIFHRLGVNVFLFDYRGYGRSAGRPSEVGTYRDAAAAWDFLVREKGVAPSNVVVFGRSLGAAVAARLAAERAPGALILESAFTSVPDMAARLYPFLPARWLCRMRYDTLAAVRRVSCPVLVVHGRDDEVVPYTHGRRLFDAARPPKRFLDLVGGHNEGFLATGRAYEAGLRAFLEEVAGLPAQQGARRDGEGDGR